MRPYYYFSNTQIKGIMNEFLKISICYNKTTLSNAVKESVTESIPTDLSPNDITWDWGIKVFHEYKDNDAKFAFCRLFRLFIAYDCVSDSQYNKILSHLNKARFSVNLFELFNDRLTPLNSIPSITNGCCHYFRTDIDAEFLYSKLEQFISENKILSAANRTFYKKFNASLIKSNISKLSDFNFDIFEIQYNYYSTFSNNTGLFNLLKNFYISLYKDGLDVFRGRNVDINYFSSFNFINWYKNSYKLIYCNPYDTVPYEDKWVLAPGELASYSTKLRKSKYITVNFSDIPNTEMRLAAKEWYWHSSINLQSRNEGLYIIKNFYNYILRQRKKTKLVPKSFLSPEEIFLYTRYILFKNQSARLNTISRFLKYVTDAGLFEIDESCYLYLKKRRQVKSEQATDIPDDHILQIEEVLKRNCDISLRNHLFYIIFHIALGTELRISSIIHLKVNCLSPDSGNIVYLNTNTKNSESKTINIVTPKRIQRLIKSAISLTKSCRELCFNNDDREHLFIYPDQNRANPLIVRTFSEYIKQVSCSLGLPPYTATNLRDTYMSKVVTMSINSGKSILEIKSLTLHQVMSTTSKHYVSKRIREYLENVYMVKIGDVDTKGVITADAEEYSNPNNLVNNSCGYCNKDGCIVTNSLPCLWCSGFTATISRIPFFEAEINAIDIQILQSNSEHDKEHLLLMKRLNMAYLEQLYILKEEQV